MLQKIGLGIFVIALIIFSMIPAFDQFDFSAATLQTDNEYHQAAISTAAENLGMEGKHYDSKRVFLGDFKKALLTAQADLNERAASGLPDGVGEWDFKIGNWKIKDYTLNNAKGMNASIVGQSPMMYWLLTIGLGMLGGLLYIIPVFQSVPGMRIDADLEKYLLRSNDIRNAYLGSVLYELRLLLVGIDARHCSADNSASVLCTKIKRAITSTLSRSFGDRLPWCICWDLLNIILCITLLGTREFDRLDVDV